MIVSTTQDKANCFAKDINDILTELKLPVISTMTIAVSLDKDINLDKLKIRINDPDIKDFISNVYGVQDGLSLKTKGAHFNNSLVFKTKTNKKLTQAIKVFCNGSLHITGFKNVQDALDAADVFSTLIEIAEGGTGISNMYNVIEFKIQLINLYYVIPQITPKKQRIQLSVFHETLSEYSTFYTSYNNDHYAGVLLKSPTFTIMAFESGNIIISSVTTAQEIAVAFKYITEFISQYHACFIKSVQDIVSKPRRKAEDPYNSYGDFFVLK